MGFFGSLKKGKKQADVSKDKKDAEKAHAAPSVPYVHKPTHAGRDAITGAPPSWRESDRARIKQANESRRNSVLMSRTASSVTANTMNTTGSYRHMSWDPRVNQLQGSSSYQSFNSNHGSMEGSSNLNGYSPGPSMHRSSSYFDPRQSMIQPVRADNMRGSTGVGYAPGPPGPPPGRPVMQGRYSYNGSLSPGGHQQHPGGWGTTYPARSSPLATNRVFARSSHCQS